jgi:hypothetical protein
MNERIKELADEATTIVEMVGPQGYTSSYANFDREKFAELIVEECMTTILKESKWYWDKDEFERANAVQNAARRLKEHFGVER